MNILMMSILSYQEKVNLGLIGILTLLLCVCTGCMNIKETHEKFDSKGKLTDRITKTDKSFTVGSKGGNGVVNLFPFSVSAVN